VYEAYSSWDDMKVYDCVCRSYFGWSWLLHIKY